MKNIFIALGCSIGDAEEIFASAEQFLELKGLHVHKKSKIMKNPPYGGVAKKEFSNAVWEVAWADNSKEESPHHLLEILQTCEDKHGRTREKKWADRTLDLDILTYGDIIMHTPNLTLPHPGIPDRDFVLSPWQEIVPKDFEIPIFGKVAILLQKLNKTL